MKRVLLFSFLFVFLFLAVTVIKAEDSSSSATTSARGEIRAEIQTKREDTRELIASRAAEFKANLQKIKDARKQTVVLNISDRIANRNSLWVAHWNVVTKRLSSILDKIQTRTDEASANGKDVSAVTTSIASARTAIATAQAAIDAQQTKTYIITITTDDTLGTNVKNAISSFQTDVKNVISLLNVARRSVENVFTTIKTVVGSGVAKTPVPTTQP